MKYLLDSNVFMQAKNLHYGFDFCPGFWQWIDERHAAGDVHSVEKVLDEIRSGGDELVDWANDRSDLFLRPGSDDLPSLREVSSWANGAGYEPSAVNTFLQVADFYIVAQAHAAEATVVTHEVPSNSVKKLKIPDACLGLGIKCMNTYEMLRVEQARFVLGQS